MMPIDVTLFQYEDIWWWLCLIFGIGLACCVIEIVLDAKSKKDV